MDRQRDNFVKRLRRLALQLLVPSVCGAVAAGQTDAPRFLQPVTAAGLYPTVFAVGDFDVDGKPDIAMAHDFDNLVVILRGNGNGTFTSGRSFPVQYSIAFIAVADFNDDDKPDLATANYTYDSVSILLGDGTGGFAPPTTYQVALSANPAALGVEDFDGDGDLDLAVVRDDVGFSHVTILFGHGDGTFSVGGTVQTGFGSRSIAVADFDGEGHPDLAIANVGTSTLSTVNIVMNDGTGGFQVTANKPVGKQPFAIAAGDVDGDGHVDLVTSNYGDHSVSVLLGTGTAAFANSISFEAGLTYPVSLALSDFNEDGDPDVGLVSQFSGSVSILLGGDGATFSSPIPWTAGFPAIEIAASDVNGDGHADILTEGHFTSGPVPALLGHGDGSFSVNAHFGAGDQPESIITADFNGDGLPDVASANGQDDTLSVLLNHANGELVPSSTVAAGDLPTSLAAGDFDDDGQVDLLVVNYLAGSITSLLGTGQGGFESAGEFDAGVYAASAAVGELNGDGIPDAAVATQAGVRILLGLGDGRFADHEFIVLDQTPRAVAISDFDGSGTLDLAVATAGPLTGSPGSVDILLGNGDATFAAPASFVTGVSPSHVVVGDFDEDGIPDLATANDDASIYTGGSVWILLGQGNGSFTSTGISQPFQPDSLAVGDLDGDGHQDLAVGASAIEILLGDGDGGFTLDGSFAAGYGPAGLAIADFDGDRLQDVAAALRYDDAVSLMLNQGPPIWTDVGLALPGDIGTPLLIGEGPLSGDAADELRLSHANPVAAAGLFFGLAAAELPFKGGTLVPSPDVLVPWLTDAAGTATLEFHLPAGVPPGLALYFQSWVQDAGAVQGLAASNGLKGVTP